MDEVLEVVKSVDFDSDGELEDALRAKGLGSDSIPAAKAVAKILSGYSDTIGKSEFAAIAKSAGYEFDTSDDDDEETDVEDLTKSDLDGLDEETRSAVMAAIDKKNDLEKRVDTLAEQLAGRIDQDRLEKNVEKAESLDGIDADANEFGETLKAIEENCDQDVYSEVVNKLEAASEAVKEATGLDSGSGSEIGSTNRDDAGSDAYEKMQKKVDELIDKNDMSRGEAMKTVEKRHPELAQEYLDSVRGQS